MSRLAWSTMTFTCNDVTMTWLHPDPISQSYNETFGLGSSVRTVCHCPCRTGFGGEADSQRFIGTSAVPLNQFPYEDLIPINQTHAKYFLSLSCPITGPGQSSDQ